MEQARDILATATSVLVVLGLAVKFVLLPWLRDQLVAPLEETRTAVTENSHRNTEPTLPDRISDLATDVRTLTHVIEQHLHWSYLWTSRTELELAELHEGKERNHDNSRWGTTPDTSAARPSSAGDGPAVVHQARQEGEGGTDRSSPA